MTNEEVESKAYRLIRIAARNVIDPMDDEQFANYVKGIVDLQIELYSVFTKEEEEKRIEIVKKIKNKEDK